MQAPISADLLVGNYISDYARHLGEKRPRCSEYINPFACRITWDHPERYRIMAVMMHQDYAQLDRARYHGSHANWPLFLKTAVINLAVLEKERGGGLYLTAPPGEAELAVRSHSWWKLIALRNALQYAPSDWLLWMDSDAHLVHSASELLGRLPEHIRSHKNALCHNPTMYVAREEPCKELRHPTSNFNLGVILLNATKVERVDATLRWLWDAKEEQCAPFRLGRNWEQSCLDRKLRDSHRENSKWLRSRLCAVRFHYLNTPNGEQIQHHWTFSRDPRHSAVNANMAGLDVESLFARLRNHVHALRHKPH